MKKFLPLLLVPALAACNLNGATRGDVSGTISNAPTGKIKVAVLAASLTGIPDTNAAQAVFALGSGGAYAADLPNLTSAGAATVIAYADTNNNDRYDPATEPKADNGKWFAYDGSTWRLMNGLTVEKVGTPFTGNNLSF